jgi:peptidoglycan/LPS O-acetylase OafA/YrhL
MATRPDLPALTSLRFFAATVVVFFHYEIGPEFTPGLLAGWFQSGEEAVVFFFLLSGFVLAYTYGLSGQNDIKVSPRSFWVARAARILPAYYAALLLALPPFLDGVFASKILPVETLAAGLIFVPLLLQAWTPGYCLLWNMPAWSLSVEALLYALFPWLWRKTAAMQIPHLLVLAYVLVLISTSVRLALADAFGPSALRALTDAIGPSALHRLIEFISYFPLFFLPTFMLGIALGRVFLGEQRISPDQSARILGAGAVMILLILGLRSSLPGWTRCDAVLVIPYGMLVLGAAGIGTTRLRALSARPLVLLGEASYAMYILHYPLIYWWHVIVDRLFVVDLPRSANFWGCVGLMLAVSFLIYFALERPMRKAVVRRFAS